MAGIYIHVPFCKSRCIYCDFYSSTNSSILNEFVDALCHELIIRKNEAKYNVDTLYIGGGTPSLLNQNNLEKIFKTLHSNYNFNNVNEITIEVNPDDINKEKIQFYKQLGINRISIGVQSFNDDILKTLSRRHNAKQAIDAIICSHEMGFENVSIDLIYGINGLTEEIWINTLQTALQLPIKHISAYHLTIEEGTPLYFNYLNKEYFALDEEESVNQYNILCQTLAKANYKHYEVSNFSIKGYESVHNSSYWNGESYIGVGPSAHSYNDFKRRWNVSSLETYLKQIFSEKDYFEEVVLSTKERFNEIIMTKLRTSEGLILNELKELDECLFFKLSDSVEKLKQKSLLIEENNRLYISEEMWLLSDYIVRELFI